MLRPFTLHRPATAEDACALLGEHGDEALPYAGGTELLLVMKLGLAQPRHLVDVKRLPGFDTIRMDGEELVIGAAVTHRAVERSPLVRQAAPLLAGVARHVANVRVRNVGTVGGNLAFADPHSDVATLLAALDARVELVSRRERRVLPLAEFVRGPYDTARVPDELIAAVRFTPWPPETTVATYVKFGVHERPTLGIAVALTLDGVRRISGVEPRAARLAVGCVNARPERIGAAEAQLAGMDWRDVERMSRDVAAVAAGRADPVNDLHGSAEYKRELVAVFTRRALAVAAGRARGVEPAVEYPHTVIV